MKKSPVTAVDIATRLGLAPTTVAHVLAGRGSKVRIKQETQERILTAASEMGYRPNASARAMRTGRFGCVALMQPWRGLYLPSELLLGLSEALEQRNMHLSITQVPDAALTDAGYLPKIIRELTADGLLLNTIFDLPPAFRDALRAHHVPTLWLNLDRESDCIHPDDYGGGVLAARHLLELGHRRIAFVHIWVKDHPWSHYSERDRYAGYADAMRAEGLEPRYYTLAAGAERGGHLSGIRLRNAEELLRSEDRPTAIVAYEYEAVVPLMIAAAKLGLSIPRDLSVVMFHREEEQSAGIAITTVRAEWRAIGHRAVALMEEKIKAPDTPIPTCVIPSALIPGGTTAPPAPSA